MSKFQRTASLFVVGVKDFRWTPELSSFLKDYPVSGLALFNSPFDSPDNIWKDKQAALEVVHDFVHRAQSLVRFISADQEGGRVRRLRSAYLPLPSAKVMSENFSRDPKRVERIYDIAAEQMSMSEIRLNFAPVCDIHYPESNNVVGDRSFGSADDVRRMAKVFCNIFETRGVHTTLKHFPGHGPTRFDSHERMATLFKSKEEMLKEDTSLFKELAPYASAVMTAHVGFEDESGLPFSMNPKLFEEFKSAFPVGKVLMTDDIQNMKAVSEEKPWLKALQLPYDFILLCGTLDQAAESLEESIRFQEDQISKFSDEQRWESRVKKSESHFVSKSKIQAFPTWKSRMLQLEAEGLELIQGLTSDHKA